MDGSGSKNCPSKLKNTIKTIVNLKNSTVESAKAEVANAPLKIRLLSCASPIISIPFNYFTIYLALFLADGWTFIVSFLILLMIIPPFILQFSVLRELMRAFPGTMFFPATLNNIAVSACLASWLSGVMYRLTDNAYVGSMEISYPNLVYFYVWNFLDLIPILEITDTLNIKAPFTIDNWVAGIPVLLFKIAVVFGIFASIVDWWKAR